MEIAIRIATIIFMAIFVLIIICFRLELADEKKITNEALHYKNAWLKLAQCLDENQDQAVLDLMDSIFKSQDDEL